LKLPVPYNNTLLIASIEMNVVLIAAVAVSIAFSALELYRKFSAFDALTDNSQLLRNRIDLLNIEVHPRKVLFHGGKTVIDTETVDSVNSSLLSDLVNVPVVIHVDDPASSARNLLANIKGLEVLSYVPHNAFICIAKSLPAMQKAHRIALWIGELRGQHKTHIILDENVGSRIQFTGLNDQTTNLIMFSLIYPEAANEIAKTWARQIEKDLGISTTMEAGGSSLIVIHVGTL
jgi:hypothetical protein